MTDDLASVLAGAILIGAELRRLDELRVRRDELIRRLYGHGVTTPALAAVFSISESAVKAIVAGTRTRGRRQDRNLSNVVEAIARAHRDGLIHDEALAHEIRRSVLPLISGPWVLIQRRHEGGYVMVEMAGRTRRLLQHAQSPFSSRDAAEAALRELDRVEAVPCPACDGGGYVQVTDQCPSCRGRRYVPRVPETDEDRRSA